MAMSPANQWAITAGVSLVVGLAVIARALIGKKVRATPTCAGCGFDLSGTLDPVEPSRTTRPCPECGRDVTKPGAVRSGTRRRSSGLAVVGTLILGGSIGAGALSRFVATGGNLLAMEPNWLVIAQSDGFLGHASPASLAELLSREKAGALTDADIRALVPCALAAQADVSRAWDSQWGDVVAAAHRRGIAADSQCRQFMQGAVELKVLSRERVRVGLLTDLTWGSEAGRGPTSSWTNRDSVLVRELRGTCYALDGGGVVSSFDPSDNISDSQNGSFGSECGSTMGMTHDWGLPPGIYEQVLEAHAEVGFRHMRQEDAGWRVRTRSQKSLVILPADRAAVRNVADSAIAAQLLRECTLQVFLQREDRWDARCQQMV